MATYFGETTEHASFYGDTSGYWNVGLVFTCPGSGNQTVSSLGVYGKKGGGSAGNVRCAIYTSAGVFVAQGSAEISVDNTTAQWWEHTSFTLRGGSSTTPVLTGVLIIYLDFRVILPKLH